MWNLKAYKKFEAWKDQNGRPRTDARKDFIQLTEAILAAQSNDENAKKEGKYYIDNLKAITNTNVNPGY